MAITVNIYYSGVKGNAKKFAKEMVSTGIVEDIRAEKGNIKYEYFFPMDDEDTVLLIDSWTDQDALDKHHESSMMSQIAELREKYDLHMKVERYMADIDNSFTKDSAFIRK
ncbi:MULTISPECIES: putative quinol monooxygenase [Enterococcus]|uniref:Antibiotic biosynthesis monooxygenase n=1 Tax=Enterococcus faecium TaxID=1352 RepID=A0AB73NUB9_ENTFC|nr:MULTISPECIES: putative quinol monooxygenase [Enterococcus]EGP4750438.1 antibiotic biosynthesis monooxygenase [Enterococcus faecium]EGP4927762.1 antibiotic biosynthesis monooxygenase [Enterococcus faecium]EGP4985523.1 antibiotic biosynthesis monooxygenase [Enterococcus faecium]EGP5055209.1 antibiotic biosynthesis monooxygenase [Enterococcus faecium]EGP5088670.1 antibiotic biosynthesis monooxygenase [Enterococcus faecium]